MLCRQLTTTRSLRVTYSDWVTRLVILVALNFPMKPHDSPESAFFFSKLIRCSSLASYLSEESIFGEGCFLASLLKTFERDLITMIQLNFNLLKKELLLCDCSLIGKSGKHYNTRRLHRQSLSFTDESPILNRWINYLHFSVGTGTGS